MPSAARGAPAGFAPVLRRVLRVWRPRGSSGCQPLVGAPRLLSSAAGLTSPLDGHVLTLPRRVVAIDDLPPASLSVGTDHRLEAAPAGAREAHRAFALVPRASHAARCTACQGVRSHGGPDSACCGVLHATGVERRAPALLVVPRELQVVTLVRPFRARSRRCQATSPATAAATGSPRHGAVSSRRPAGSSMAGRSVSSACRAA